eukprot:3844159-Heterocapsa_arctica.AAC.1
MPSTGGCGTSSGGVCPRNAKACPPPSWLAKAPAAWGVTSCCRPPGAALNRGGPPGSALNRGICVGIDVKAVCGSAATLEAWQPRQSVARRPGTAGAVCWPG